MPDESRKRVFLIDYISIIVLIFFLFVFIIFMLFILPSFMKVPAVAESIITPSFWIVIIVIIITTIVQGWRISKKHPINI